MTFWKWSRRWERRRVGEVFEGERSFPLVLRLPEAQREDPAALAATLVPTRTGAILPLKALADITEEQRPSTINREWGRRLLKVSVSVPGTRCGLLRRRGTRRH